MKLYEVNPNDGTVAVTYATKREATVEARRLARELSPNSDERVEIDEVTIGRVDKAMIVRFANSEGGYVDERRTIAAFPKRGKGY